MTETADTRTRQAEVSALLLDALKNFTEGRDISYVDALIAARAAIAEAEA